MPPSLTNPLPLIVTTVPGQVPAAVTTCGTAALPPTQLVIVTAPADAATPRPSATSTERQSAVLTSDTRVKALPLTSRALPPEWCYMGISAQTCFYHAPAVDATAANGWVGTGRGQRTGKTPLNAFPLSVVLANGKAPRRISDAEKRARAPGFRGGILWP